MTAGEYRVLVNSEAETCGKIAAQANIKLQN